MGSGKSTVGPLLARALDLPFVDLDRRLEAEAGIPIHEWFARRGEADFRAAEHAALAASCRELGDRGGVLALGGGAFGTPATRALLAVSARTIWLDIPLEVALARMPLDGRRPLLADPASVAALHARRTADYAQADHRIDANAPVDVVVASIRAALGAATAGP